MSDSPPPSLIWLTETHRPINIGKYGTFQANHTIGRPYYLTFEILDRPNHDHSTKAGLRIVPAAELYANIDDESASTSDDLEIEPSTTTDTGVEYEVVGQDGQVVMRTNRQIIDDPTSQILTMSEIEALKAQGSGSGKEIVAKILESHSALDQKTAFALAKYTLRKTKKYLKRFTVLPLDVHTMARWMLTNKEPLKIMDMREETLSLIGSWSNIHYSPSSPWHDAQEEIEKYKGGRWLMVDETAGMLVAYMAEKMGILHASEQGDGRPADANAEVNGHETEGDHEMQDAPPTADHHTSRPRKSSKPASSNTITLIHANAQPNLSLLKYFSFDPFNPSPTHPLTQHLKMISWLQVLSPEDDMGYTEPEHASDETLASWKSGKRSTYYRKRRRWERIKSIVDETRAGGFDGLVVASVMQPATILLHAVPLLRGGAQVVVYSPTIEPLAELADYYSTGRRTAFLADPLDAASLPTEDFPLNPALLLGPTIQTVKARGWQVLPGRTHPLMTGRGGSEGYVFTATRVHPAEGKIEARGNFKRRKVDETLVAGEK